MRIRKRMLRTDRVFSPDLVEAGWKVNLLSYPLVATGFFLLFLIFAFVPGGVSGASDLLRGPDDMMRVVQVLDSDGQSWHDTVQRRLDPPAGVAMHWSRLSDLPLAVAIGALEPFAGRGGAVYLAVLLVPAILGGVFAAVFVWAAAPLAGRMRVLVPILMMGALILPIQQLLPGRVDHHGLQLVLAMLACGFLVRATISEIPFWALWIGVVGGLSLAIGLEALPLVGAVTIALGLVWAVRGGATASLLLAFGAALWVTVLVLIPVVQPPSRWTVITCDQMSVVHLALAGIVLVAGALAYSFQYLTRETTWLGRHAIVGGAGSLGLGAVVAAFPECAGGPYANLPEEAMYWFRTVSEAQPLLVFGRRNPGPAMAYVILPLVAFAATAWQSLRTSNPSRPLWLTLCVLVGTGLALTFWQARGFGYAGLFAGLALVPLAAAFNRRADRADGVLVRVGLRVCLPLLALIAVFACFNIFPSSKGGHVAQRRAVCDVRQAAAALNDPQGLGAASLTIAAPIYVGPTLLFLTRHSVLAGPYHRNVGGLVDNRRIFAGSEKESLETINRRDVKAILFCTEFARLSRYGDRPPFLSARLTAGNPPGWLAPVVVGKGFGLYSVRLGGDRRP